MKMGDESEESRSGLVPFSAGLPASSDPDTVDSGLVDARDLTSSFLPPAHDDDTPHSSLRLLARKIGSLLLTITLLTMLLVIPAVTYKQVTKNQLDYAAFESAAVMVAGTVVLSVRLVYLHLTHWYMPNVQKYVLRIIWMVPLYSMQSWLSLVYGDLRIYIDAARDLYEAYVIASFLSLLVELLGGEDQLIRTLQQKARNDPATAEHLGDHGWFLNHVLEPWELGFDFVMRCKHGVLQYVVVKTVATVLTFFCQWLHVYGEGDFKWNVAYPYLAFLLNVSVMYALYCLVKLFHAVNDELRHPIDWHPLGKFLCVKGVVFFTYWQSLLISFLQWNGIIADIGSWTEDKVANGLIEYCICIEMVGFAIAHSYTFTYTEYLPATIQHAMNEYASLQQQQDEDNTNYDAENDARSMYRPPATLRRPMNMRQAFLSSTLPSETFQDIRRLRNGIDQKGSSDPRTMSLQNMGAEEISVE